MQRRHLLLVMVGFGNGAWKLARTHKIEDSGIGWLISGLAGLSGCDTQEDNGFRTIGTYLLYIFSDYRVFRPVGFRTIGFSDQWAFGPMGFWNILVGMAPNRHPRSNKEAKK